ncbi:MAG TPA: alpha/beta fold hydrolase [Thermoanaerobaculia bacterium]|nr:alpha/beta fold hydrolase [Thermoanaerobaculia bacterium]
MRRLAFLFLLAASARADDLIVKNFHFHDGEMLEQVRLHYLTIGKPRKDNVVLILHGTGGSSKQFLNDHFAGVLFKTGGLLDSSKYFIVIPDSIGHGDSSKPSDGLGRKFPHYDYTDMTELQHRLIESLGVDHLFLVMGTSMGAMHTWMWGERWPDMMDALVPLAGAPTQIAGRNRVWRKMVIDDLQRGDTTSALQIMLIATSAPLQWQKSAPTRDDADRWLAEQMKTRTATTKADDLLYALEASRDYDPSPDLEKIKAPLLAINSADDFVNPPELGLMEKLIPRVPRGRYVLIPTSDRTHGHGTHTWPEVWGDELAKFLATISHQQ